MQGQGKTAAMSTPGDFFVVNRILSNPELVFNQDFNADDNTEDRYLKLGASQQWTL